MNSMVFIELHIISKYYNLPIIVIVECEINNNNCYKKLVKFNYNIKEN